VGKLREDRELGGFILNMDDTNIFIAYDKLLDFYILLHAFFTQADQIQTIDKQIIK